MSKVSEPNNRKWRPATRLVRGGTQRSEFDETSEGIFMTSGYVYDTAESAEAAFKGETARYIYSRYANPTVTMFEERLALLEGAGYCVGTSSGMAAVFASLMSQLRAGEQVVASRALFGSCHYIIQDMLPNFGINVQFVDGTDLVQWEAALATPTKAVFLETPSNPTLDIIDLSKVAELSHASGARLIVDNVFATPILQHPLEFGADIVMYSATKHIDGQGRALGGAILTNDAEFIDEFLTPFMRHTGPAMSPMNAFHLLQGIETLPLRMERHCQNALAVAKHLEDHKKVDWVSYAGLPSHPHHDLAKKYLNSRASGIMTFGVKGGFEAGVTFYDKLNLFKRLVNIGDAKSLACHPASTTHRQLSENEQKAVGVVPEAIRLSVGIEHIDDILEDIEQALS